jgi:hypothetical protein
MSEYQVMRCGRNRAARLPLASLAIGGQAPRLRLPPMLGASACAQVRRMSQNQPTTQKRHLANPRAVFVRRLVLLCILAHRPFPQAVTPRRAAWGRAARRAIVAAQTTTRGANPEQPTDTTGQGLRLCLLRRTSPPGSRGNKRHIWRTFPTRAAVRFACAIPAQFPRTSKVFSALVRGIRRRSLRRILPGLFMRTPGRRRRPSGAGAPNR